MTDFEARLLARGWRLVVRVQSLHFRDWVKGGTVCRIPGGGGSPVFIRHREEWVRMFGGDIPRVRVEV